MRFVSLIGLLLLACGAGESPYPSPAQTYGTYKDAVLGDRPHEVWACFGAGYRQLEYEDSLERWLAAWPVERATRQEAVRHLQIQQEKLINDRIGFLRFDDSTVEADESPFFYFVQEEDSWKVTTHLDPAFRQALEQAVAEGEFRLPFAR